MQTNVDLIQALSKLSEIKVLCLGDVMVDRFVYGETERISPEAPVPVLHINREFMVVGGAGNVVRNLSALGAQIQFMGVIGSDAIGIVLNELLADLSNVTAHLYEENLRKTTLKTRFIANGQHLLRVDDELILKPDLKIQQKMIADLKTIIKDCQVVILSDYGKGLLTVELCAEVIKLARKHGLIVIVDPKGRDYGRYRGATVLTPNQKELAEITGRALNNSDDFIEATRLLRDTYEVQSVLVTRGSKGMTLIDGDQEPVHIATQAREVFDVSGAGDTVVASLALAMATGLNLEMAARLANIAAGIVVSKVGTAVVHKEELEKEMGQEIYSDLPHKLRTRPEAVDSIKMWHRKGLKVGFTNGCFDLLHPGHIHLLEQARRACDRLIVGLNSDSSVKRLKGPERPIQNQESRARLLAALSVVDMVVYFEEDTPLELITKLLPDVLIKGSDYTIDRVVGADIVQANGGKVVLAELRQGFSTTSTVAKLQGVSKVA
jgi:D-beta-D-heptose 7-phosphate kinase/D-beta-D-heptose 1-phosphate adenosyltransferase